MSAENTQIASDEAILEETFLLATNPSNADELAVSMFCGLIHSKEKLVGKAIELLLSKIQSQDVAQSLRALTILEECMSEAGPEFQAKVSKFRFLNELTFLVSKRHKGNLTPQKIKDKIMDCFLLWTTQYPDKVKIKEAYDKLCSEGINHTPSTMPPTTAVKRSIFLDAESEKKFGELLRSKNKEDLKKANLLIQYHVNQDIKRSERIQRQKDKLEEANETVDILDEVLNRLATDNDVNTEEKSLAKDLVTSCKKLKTEIEMITRIIEDSQEDLLCDAIKVSERLLNVIEKYKSSHKRPQKRDVTPTATQTKIDDLLSDFTDIGAQSTSQEPQAASMDELNDIFSQIPDETPTNLNIFPQGEILAPVQVHNKGDEKPSNMEALVNGSSLENNSSIKTSLHVIDKISEELFKENLKDKERISTFKKEPIKIPLNALIKIEKTTSPDKDEDSNPADLKETINDATSQIIDSILNETNTTTEFPVNDLMLGDKSNYIDQLKELTVNDTNKKSTMEINTIIEDIVSKVENVIKLQPDDDEGNKVDALLPENLVNSPTKENEMKCIKRHFKHLSDIHVELTSIQPSMVQPRKLMDDIQSLCITLQFALDRPSSNVLVIVISTVNQSYLPMEDYHFDASVPKPCKIRLLEPTGCSLPGVKAFGFPTDHLKQILLLFNPTEKPVDITCIISYKLGDDPDPIKESIVAKSIPFVE